MQTVQRALIIKKRRGLHDLYFQTVRRKLGASQDAGHHGWQVPIFELQSREIDGNLDVGRPSRTLCAGLAQHPPTDRIDEPSVLGRRNEVVRSKSSTHRVVPA